MIALAAIRAAQVDLGTRVDRHLRTTQRMVKAWRADQAKRMIRCGTAALTIVVDVGSIAPPPPPWVHRDLPRDAAPDS